MLLSLVLKLKSIDFSAFAAFDAISIIIKAKKASIHRTFAAFDAFSSEALKQQ